MQQTLQQAITAHQDGKLEDAEVLYQSILEIHPTHPDANHNLGVLAVSLNQLETALPLFKTALEAYPDQEQFWLSYIDALIKAKQFDNARNMLNQGKNSGFAGEKVDTLEACLALSILAQTSYASFNHTNQEQVRSPSQMELNILLEHYQNRRYDQAEDLAKDIAHQYPNDQLSWKVLSAIFWQTGRSQESLIAHQRTVEISTEDTEAHNELGNTLQELGRLEEAKVSYNKALAVKPESAEIHFNLGNTLLKLGKLKDAETSYKKVVLIKPDLAIAHNNLGVTLLELGRPEEAEASYRKAIAIKPDYAEAYYNLGLSLKELGRLEEAETSYKKTIAFKPDYALAHNNLGVMMQELGRLEEAEASLRNAIAIKPDYAEAHNNLGTTLQELNSLEEAEASYRKAIAIKPDYAEAYYNLGNILKELGRIEEALATVIKSIKIKPISEAKNLFIEITKKIDVEAWDESLAQFVITALLEPWGRPADLMSISCKLLKSNKDFINLLNQFKDSCCQDNFSKSLLSLIPKKRFTAFSLLDAMLSSSPIPDAEIESFLIVLRQHLLQEAESLIDNEWEIEYISLYYSLAQQCFVNEYVYYQTPKEVTRSQQLRDRLTKVIEDQQDIPELLVISVACYFPLFSVESSKQLLNQKWSDGIKCILKQQLQEPLDELNLYSSLTVLSGIDNKVSLAVQTQYEENPYPRWIRLPKNSNKKFLNTYIYKKFPLSSFKSLADDKNPEILVAGCGTGQHSIEVSQSIMGAKIMAIDLSKASLAYAVRKTAELNIDSINYAQADILKLTSLGYSFDVIESAGVLHHLENPFKGWEILLSLLRPHGLMSLGLYSELARRDFVTVRNLISKDGIGSSPQAIRDYRKYLLSLKDSVDYGLATRSIDFFCTSTCRDLLFHVQEHRMNLKVLTKFLSDHDLNFLGFTIDSSVRHSYKKRFPNDMSATDLNNWHIYEEENPNTFIGMYQFWIQKKS